MSLRPLAIVFVAVFLFVCPVEADTFGAGQNEFAIEFVAIGNPGNPSDTGGIPNPAGKVSYVYRMGQHEISEQMIQKANAATAGDTKPLNITIDTRGPNKPATGVSWVEAALFVNWLNTSSGYSPAYKFKDLAGVQPPPPNAALRGLALWEPGDVGYDPVNQYRNTQAFYFLPSVDEWYKSAFYQPTTEQYFPYPTSTLVLPTPVVSGTAADTAVFDQDVATGPADIMLAGGPSPYDTIGQGGNVNEWMETESDLVNNNVFDYRLVRGGDWMVSESVLRANTLGSDLPRTQIVNLGFRVASVPEPNGCLFFFTFLFAMTLRRSIF